MRPAGLFLALVLVLVAAVACAGEGTTTPASTAPPSGNRIVMQNFAFNPAQISVSVGETVTWENKDAVTHIVVGSGWGSGDLGLGGTYNRKFDTAGTFSFSCGIHPFMTGSVTVR